MSPKKVFIWKCVDPRCYCARLSLAPWRMGTQRHNPFYSADTFTRALNHYRTEWLDRPRLVTVNHSQLKDIWP